MMRKKSSALALVLVLCPALAAALAAPSEEAGARAAAKKKVTIVGYVFNSKRAPLGGVDVGVWVTGRGDQVGGTRTSKDGKYSVSVEVTDSFDVAYSMTKYRTGIVTFLAEQKDQRISRVLYTRGENLPASAAHAYIQSMDRVAFLATALPLEERKRFLSKFEDVGEIVASGGTITKMPVVKGHSATIHVFLSEEARRVAMQLKTLSGRGKE